MKKQIPILRPSLPVAKDLLPYLEEIDRNHTYTNFGPLLKRFEERLLKVFFTGDGLALTTISSGTHALELALQALGIPPGKSVLVPSFTFPATITAILKNGLVPRFVDVDPACWQLTPSLAMASVQDTEIAAVLPVATFGVPVDAAGWQGFHEETGLPVVVDAAAAVGAQQVGPGPAWCFSLHATKPFSSGEGGLVVSHNHELVEKVRTLTNFGISLAGGQIGVLGTNAKLSEYHAAVGLASFSLWDSQKLHRRQLLRWYKEKLASLPCHLQQAGEDWIPSVFPVYFEPPADVQQLADALLDEGVQTRRWYYPACHNHSNLLGGSLVEPVMEPGMLEVTEDLAARTLGLPFHLFMEEEDVDYICQVLKRAIC